MKPFATSQEPQFSNLLGGLDISDMQETGSASDHPGTRNHSSSTSSMTSSSASGQSNNNKSNKSGNNYFNNNNNNNNNNTINVNHTVGGGDLGTPLSGGNDRERYEILSHARLGVHNMSVGSASSIEMVDVAGDGYGQMMVQQSLDEDAVSVISSAAGGGGPGHIDRADPTTPGLASDTQTFFNILKSFIGTGILLLPRAMRNSGIILGGVSLALISLASLVCMQLLVKVKERLRHRNVKTFGDIGYEILGKWGARLVDTMLLATQLGFCCGYFLFMGKTLHGLVPRVPVNVWILVMFPFANALCLLRSLRKLAPVAIAGLAAIGIGVAFVLVYSMKHLSSPKQDEEIEHDAFLVKSFPLFFGIVVAAFEGIGLVLPTQGSMAKPQNYPRLLNYALLVVTVAYLGVALIGYLSFGRNTCEVITLNFPQADIGVVLVELCLVFAILFTYPLQLHPVIEVAERSRSFERIVSKGNRTTRVNLIRTAIVLVTLVVAVIIPKFDLLINLVGSLASATLAFILPAVFHYKLFKESLTQKEIIMDAFFVIFGGIGAVTGTSLSIAEIVKSFVGKGIEEVGCGA